MSVLSREGSGPFFHALCFGSDWAQSTLAFRLTWFIVKMTPPATVCDDSGPVTKLPTENNMTSDTSIASNTLEDTEVGDAGESVDGYQTVISRRTKKRRKKRGGGKSNSGTHTAIPDLTTPPGLTVIFSPVDKSNLIRKVHALKLSKNLEGHAPNGVMHIRHNRRLSIIAVDTRNTESTTSLLAIKTLCGVKVRAYEPRPASSTVGVIKDVDDTISEQELF